MRTPSARTVCGSLAVIAIAFSASRLKPDPDAPVRMPAGFFARAVSARAEHQIALCFAQGADPNSADAEGHTPLVIASAQEDWPLVRRLVEAGADPDVADASGLTPLMIAATRGELEIIRLLATHSANADAIDRAGQTALHHALLAHQNEAAKLLLPLMSRFDLAPEEGRDLLNLAFAADDADIERAILERVPPAVDWTPASRRALHRALKAKNNDQVRLLLAKHRAPPTIEGDNIPLLAQAIVDGDTPIVRTLLDCGADPNTLLPKPCSKQFIASVSSKLMRNYLEEDNGITVLMLAASLGRADSVRALLSAGADRNRSTAHDKWIALYFAARSKNWQSLQTLLGGGPAPDELRVEVSLAAQHAALIKHGVPIFTTAISTGRAGYSTPAGDYVVTDKERDHRSTIYKVPMPYFMRLSCLDFGMHEGVVPRYPASHGCIRLPGDAARRLFSEIPVGTVVTIN